MAGYDVRNSLEQAKLDCYPELIPFDDERWGEVIKTWVAAHPNANRNSLADAVLKAKLDNDARSLGKLWFDILWPLVRPTERQALQDVQGYDS
jgi:hypothetical protein